MERNGHDVIYRAALPRSPVISGGRQITGWQPDTGNRWKANTELDDFRQLYVGGVRAIRARSGKLTGKRTRVAGNSCECVRGGGLKEGNDDRQQGYRTTAVEMAGWRNIGDIEFCYVGVRAGLMVVVPCSLQSAKHHA